MNMNVKDAIKQVKEENTRNKNDGKAFLKEKGHKLLKLIREENRKSEFQHVYLMDGFMKRTDDDLDYSSTLTKVIKIENGRVYFSAHCYWAYGGYADGEIIIPIKNLELSPDEIRKKSLDYSVKYFNHEIKEENENWEYYIKRHEDKITKIKNNLTTVKAIKIDEKKLGTNMTKKDPVEINDKGLSCSLCKNWNPLAKKCSIHYRYISDTRCIKRKTERNE